jgi:hypothetical protein
LINLTIDWQGHSTVDSRRRIDTTAVPLYHITVNGDTADALNQRPCRYLALWTSNLSNDVQSACRSARGPAVLLSEAR